MHCTQLPRAARLPVRARARHARAVFRTEILHVYGFDPIGILFPRGGILQNTDKQLPRKFDPKDLSL